MGNPKFILETIKFNLRLRVQISGKTAQYYLLVSRDVVAVALMKLRPIMLTFGAYITNQSTFRQVGQQ